MTYSTHSLVAWLLEADASGEPFDRNELKKRILASARKRMVVAWTNSYTYAWFYVVGNANVMAIFHMTGPGTGSVDLTPLGKDLTGGSLSMRMVDYHQAVYAITKYFGAQECGEVNYYYGGEPENVRPLSNWMLC